MKSTNNFYKHFLIWQQRIYGKIKIVAISVAITTKEIISFILCYAVTDNDPTMTFVIAKNIICIDIVFVSMTNIVVEKGFSYSEAKGS